MHSRKDLIDKSSSLPPKTISIELKEDYLPLQTGFKWEIPLFALVTGKNGVGKTRLLSYIAQILNSNICPYDSGIFSNKVIMIDTGFLSILEGVFPLIGYRGLGVEFTNTEVKVDEDRNKVYTLEEEEFSKYLDCHYPPSGYNNGKWSEYIMLLVKAFGRDLVKREKFYNKHHQYIWDLINQELFKLNLGFFIKAPDPQQPSIKFEFKKEGDTLSYQNLSSGEKIIFILVAWQVLFQQKTHIKQAERIFLLDEIDKHFHPSLTKMYFEIIHKILNSTEGKLHVIMTTHNPTTLALAEEEQIKIYLMEKDTTTNKVAIRQAASKKQAISVLSDGMLTVVKDQKYVVVEALDDVKFYNIVYQKFLCSTYLNEKSTKLIFMPSGVQFKVQEKFQSEFNSMVNALKAIQESYKELESELRNAQGKQNNQLGTIVKLLTQFNNKANIIHEYANKEFYADSGQVEQRVKIKQYVGEYDEKGKVLAGKGLRELESRHNSEMIWGIRDKDYGENENKSEGNLHALYIHSIENCLYAPLNLFYFLQQKYTSQRSNSLCVAAFKEVVEELENNPTQPLLQKISDFVIDTLKEQMVQNLMPNIQKVFESCTVQDQIRNQSLRKILIEKVWRFCAIHFKGLPTKEDKNFEKHFKTKVQDLNKEIDTIYTNNVFQDESCTSGDLQKISESMLNHFIEHANQVFAKVTLPNLSLTHLSSVPITFDLVNGIRITYPEIFCSRGHFLEESINLIFGKSKKDTAIKKEMFNVLERIPAGFLSRGLLENIENLVCSRSF